MRSFLRFVVLVVLLNGATLLFGQGAGGKSPVPAQAALDEALTLAKEVYGEEYAKAKTADQKQTLVEKLLQKASESRGDPAAYFVLLRLARDIAALGGHGDLALQAVNRMAETFEIDAYPMKVETLLRAANAASLAKQHRTVVEAARGLQDEAVSNDDFEPATQLGEAALAAAKKTGDTSLFRQVVADNRDVAVLAAAYVPVRAALAKLEVDPADPDANLIVGKYLCLLKGDWEKGVSHLALGSDAALKDLAVRDLKSPTTTDDLADLGDGWWDLASGCEGIPRRRLQERATHFYQKALPGLKPLMKDRVERRIRETIETEISAKATPPRREFNKPSSRQGSQFEGKNWISLIDSLEQFQQHWKRRDERVNTYFDPSTKTVNMDGCWELGALSRGGEWKEFYFEIAVRPPRRFELRINGVTFNLDNFAASFPLGVAAQVQYDETARTALVRAGGQVIARATITDEKWMKSLDCTFILKDGYSSKTSIRNARLRTE